MNHPPVKATSNALAGAARRSGMHVLKLLEASKTDAVKELLADSNLLHVGAAAYAGQHGDINEVMKRARAKMKRLGQDISTEDLVALGKLQVECAKAAKDAMDSLVGIVPRALGCSAADAKKTQFPEDGKVQGVQPKKEEA